MTEEVQMQNLPRNNLWVRFRQEQSPIEEWPQGFVPGVAFGGINGRRNHNKVRQNSLPSIVTHYQRWWNLTRIYYKGFLSPTIARQSTIRHRIRINWFLSLPNANELSGAHLNTSQDLPPVAQCKNNPDIYEAARRTLKSILHLLRLPPERARGTYITEKIALRMSQISSGLAELLISLPLNLLLMLESFREQIKIVSQKILKI